MSINLSNKYKLHIVSFDVPYPADYGGAIDVFYKIKSLSESGVELYLHCYEYGRARQQELHKYCKEVWYYPRTIGIRGISFDLPYIVSSRYSKILLDRLRQIDGPILFEGVHTTRFLSNKFLKDRFKAIRIHNIEQEYYYQLYRKESSPFKKIYFLLESFLLLKYEKGLGDAEAFYALSQADNDYFDKLYPNAKHRFIPPFHQGKEVNIKMGKGNYCIYHGNLSHPENIEAVLFLLNEVFYNSDVPLIIAGKNPTEKIVQLCARTKNCRLFANPDENTLIDLMTEAQIHVLPTFQQTGMKLKLITALFCGRHVLVNKEMLHGTGLGNACETATDATGFKEKITRLMIVPFEDNNFEKRKEILANYSNSRNAKQLIESLFENR